MSKFRVLLFSCLLTSILSPSLYGQDAQLYPDVIIKGESYVTAIAETGDGSYLIGGLFDHVGTKVCSNLVKIDQNGNLDESFEKIFVDDHILKIVVLPDGKILIGGWFNDVNGIQASLIRLNSDGSIDDTFQSLAVEEDYYYISSFELQSDGKIVVVGWFYIDAYRHMIRLNENGTIDDSFNTVAGPNYLTSIYIDDNDDIYASGGYSFFKYTSNGSASDSFPIELDGPIYNIAGFSDKIAISGYFQSVEGATRENFAVITKNGVLDPLTIDMGDSPVDEMLVTPDSKIVMRDSYRMRAFNSSGTEISSQYLNDYGVLFRHSSGTYLASGMSLEVDGEQYPFLARFNSYFTVDESFSCELSATTGINSVASNGDGRVVIATDYDAIGINEVNNKIARLKSDGTLDETFHSAISPYSIRSLAVQADGKVLVLSTTLQRLNSDGSLDETFESPTSLPGIDVSYLHKLKIDQEGDIYLMGQFNKIGSHVSPGIIKLNPENGSVLTDFASGLPADSYVTEMDFQTSGHLIVAGFFNDGGTTTNLVQLDETGGIVEDFNEGFTDGGIYHVRVDGLGRIYIGGFQLSYNDSYYDLLLRLLPNGEIDESFFPNFDFNLNSQIKALELLPDDEILVGVVSEGYGEESLLVFDDSGNPVEHAYLQYASSGRVSAAHSDGTNIFVAGRFTPLNDNSVISGVLGLIISDITGNLSALTSTRISPTQAELHWNNQIASATSIVIERSAGSNYSYETTYVADPDATSYVDSNVTGGNMYYYRIRAINSQDTTEYSNEAFIEALEAQTIYFDPIENKVYGNEPFSLTGTSSSGLPVLFTSSNPNVASITNSTVTILKAGSVTITASQPGNNEFDSAAPIEHELVIDKADQIITFELSPVIEFKPKFKLNGEASSQLPVLYESSNTAIAVVQGEYLIIHSPGTVTITASQAGNDNFNPAASVHDELTITKGTQTITFDAIPDKVYGDSFTPPVSSSSGLPVTLSSSDINIAVIEDNKISVVGAGAVTITATQSGNDNYHFAPPLTRTFTAEKATQIIVFELSAELPLDNGKQLLTATSTSGLPITFSTSDATIAVVDENYITPLKAGAITVTASQEGDKNHLPASISRDVTIPYVSQSITFSPIEARTFGDDPFELIATSSSGLAVTFASSDENILSIAGNIATILKPGSVTVTASQDGTDIFSPATPVNKNLTISKATQFITFQDLPDTVELRGGPIDIVAVSSSGLPVTFTSSNGSVATPRGLVIAVHNPGQVTLTAEQPGDEFFEAAESVSQTLTIVVITSTEQSRNNVFTVYPNPGTGNYQVSVPESLSGGRYLVLSSDGSVLSEGKLEPVEGILDLNLTHCPSGFFMLNIFNEHQRATLKIIKE